MKKLHLYKILCNLGIGTRRQVKQMIKDKYILVNVIPAISSNEKYFLEDTIE